MFLIYFTIVNKIYVTHSGISTIVVTPPARAARVAEP